MRAIVSLMKFFVGASFLFYTIALSFIVGASVVGVRAPGFASIGGMGLLIAIAAFVLLVLYTGMVALLISAHDRVCDIAAIMERRNELLETNIQTGSSDRTMHSEAGRDRYTDRI